MPKAAAEIIMPVTAIACAALDPWRCMRPPCRPQAAAPHTGSINVNPVASAILVLNAGSSSLKFSIFAEHEGELALTFGGEIDGLYTAPHFIATARDGALLGDKAWGMGVALGHDGALDFLLQFLRSALAQQPLLGVGHRVVHGGPRYFQPVRIDASVLASLEQYVPLAPLHQPHNLAPIRLLLERAPELPQVACFDTAFHHAQPSVAQAFALPRLITDRGVRRYGFHGLSYEYIANTFPRCDATAARGKVVVLHLGNGASMCAMADGRSVATTMGFTAVDGLPMGTRCGNIDPGVILYLLDELDMDARAIEKLIYQESGLLGVSGISSDMRTLEASGEPGAGAAIDLFAYRIGRELGSLAAALGGLDAIVFTAGIGENSWSLRERVCRDAAWLGLEFDPAANAAQGPRISATASRVSAWVIPTNEELMIARHTRDLLTGSAAQVADKRPPIAQ
jgi:acetate kinase